MSDFWKSYDIPAAEYGAGYECYPLFGTVHLIELALSALFLLCMVWWYRRSAPCTRRRIQGGKRSDRYAPHPVVDRHRGLEV